MTRLTIHNPDNDAHFMRIKPIKATVRIRKGGKTIAETTQALRVLETGRDIYDPVLYIPFEDVIAPLEPQRDKSTHCPLKGDAAYFTLNGEEIAWTYDRPFESSEQLRGRVAFWPARVTIEEVGDDALV
jgi:uncharacterized protein (DUF427 family)